VPVIPVVLAEALIRDVKVRGGLAHSHELVRAPDPLRLLCAHCARYSGGRPISPDRSLISSAMSSLVIAPASATNYGRHSVSDFNQGRLSEGLGRGQGHCDDNGNAGQGTGQNDHCAYMHSDLRQSSVSFGQVLANIRGGKGDRTAFIGQSGGFGGQFNATDTPPGGGEPQLANVRCIQRSGNGIGAAEPD
jgi:hypothetical protein